MKILIDGHALSVKKKTGKHFHTISIIRALLNHKKSSEYDFHMVVSSTKNIPIKNKKLKIIKARSGIKFYIDFYNLQKKYHLVISPTSFISAYLVKNHCLTFIYDLAVYNSRLDPNRKAQIIEKILLPQIIKRSYLITMTQSIKNELINHFPNHKFRKLDVIPGFSKFSGKTNRSNLKKPKVPYILFVGTNEPRKNLYNTLRSYKKCIFKLKREGGTIPNFYIVGKQGWQQKSIDSIAKQLGIGRYVKAVGYVSDKRLSNIYTNCLFVVYIPFYEGFGLPVIEALDHKKAVLTSNHTTLKEVLGPCGITSNPLDIEKISNSMCRLISDPHLRSTYERKSVKWIKNYTSEKSSGMFYKIIERYSKAS